MGTAVSDSVAVRRRVSPAPPVDAICTFAGGNDLTALCHGDRPAPASRRLFKELDKRGRWFTVSITASAYTLMETQSIFPPTPPAALQAARLPVIGSHSTKTLSPASAPKLRAGANSCAMARIFNNCLKQETLKYREALWHVISNKAI